MKKDELQRKAKLIKLIDEDGEEYFWTYWREKVTHRQSGLQKRTLKSFKVRDSVAWTFRDHEGYERTLMGNFLEFVYYLETIMENYGLKCLSKLI
jgi:hypothetical protein